jgi:hypothetical protein
MKMSRHAQKRLQQRGLDLTVLQIIEEVILPKYSNNSQQFFLKRRDVLEIGSMIRRIADKFEKSAGTKMIFDSSGSTLITVYRKK